MIELSRLEKLINNEEEPETYCEQVFLDAYNAGVKGDLFSILMISEAEKIDEFTAEVWQHFALGYSMGQWDYESQGNFFVESDKIKKNTH